MAASESLGPMLADRAGDILASIKETRYVHTQFVEPGRHISGQRDRRQRRQAL
jgi:hypothetical protein